MLKDASVTIGENTYTLQDVMLYLTGFRYDALSTNSEMNPVTTDSIDILNVLYGGDNVSRVYTYDGNNVKYLCKNTEGVYGAYDVAYATTISKEA